MTRCGLNKRTAERYTQLAKARSTIETGKASRTTHLSIASALRLISKKKAGPKKGPKPTTTKSTSGLSSLAWSGASIEERRKFLDAAGLAAVLEAIPVSWREAIAKGSIPVKPPSPPKLISDDAPRPLKLIADIVIPEKAAA